MARELREQREIRVEIEEGLLPKLPESMENDPDYVYRWLRVKLGGEDDWTNITRREREGWTFITEKDLPPGSNLPKQVRGAKEGVVGIDDLALARLPRDIAQARQRLAEKRAAEQTAAVNAQLERHNDARMPIINESRTQVSRGKNARFDS